MTMRITENSSDLDMGPGPELKSDEFSKFTKLVVKIISDSVLLEIARR